MVKRVIQLEASQVKDAIYDYYQKYHLPYLPPGSTISFVNFILSRHVEVGVDVPAEKAAEVKDKVFEQPINEPSFRIDDIIIVRPINVDGERIINQHGNCWRINSASLTNWYATTYKTNGRLSGELTGKHSIISIAIPKNRRSPMNCFQVVSVNSFPDEFKPSEKWKAMKMTMNMSDDELETYLKKFTV